MIPATHWANVDDGTAWWVMGDIGRAIRFEMPRTSLDRPCDVCGGAGRLPSPWSPEDFENEVCRCPDCDGTGRHTFTVEVERDDIDKDEHARIRTHRVSVVQGMVLPIYGEGDNHDGDLPHVCHSDGYLFPMPDGDDTVSGFPMPAAAPGMWAIQLRKADR